MSDAAKPEIDTAKMLDAIASVDPVDEAPAAATEPAEPVSAEPTAAGTEAEPQGVLAKNGHVIPLEVLNEARQRADASAREIGSLKERLAAYEKAGQVPDMDGLPTDEDLADYPEDLQDSVRQLRDKFLALNGTVQEMQEEKAANELEARRNHYAQEIDKFPRLKALEAQGGPRFEQGKAISARLLSDPSYHKSTGEHLADVDRELAAAIEEENRLFGIGKIEPVTPVATGQKPLPAAIPAAPASMSDIQGGVPPALNEADAFVKMNDIDAIAVMGKAKQKGEAHFNQLLTRVYR